MKCSAAHCRQPACIGYAWDNKGKFYFCRKHLLKLCEMEGEPYTNAKRMCEVVK